MITIKKEKMEKLANIHPGEILYYEFLEPLEISAYRLSKDLKIPQTRISEIIKGRRRITADTALRLSKYFGNSAKFWLGLQDDYDIEEEKTDKKDELDGIERLMGRFLLLSLVVSSLKVRVLSSSRPFCSSAILLSRSTCVFFGQ